ncbi:MAG TPA: response regulator transcription factor [Candidatus Acidoferrum sp.]|jgi:DNA-binding NarL/FixJ family response regulator
MTNILLVDDNKMIRRQVRDLLERQSQWQIAGEAENGKEAVTNFRGLQPDVTVMDFDMPGMNGLEAARSILSEYPDAAIFMLSVHLPGQLAREAQKVGIKGACPKSDIWCLRDGIKAILRGETYFPS